MAIENFIRHGDICCKYYIENKDNPLVIAFAGAGQCLNENEVANEKSPWAYDFLKKSNINVLAISHVNSSLWYITKDTYYLINYLANELIPDFSYVFGYAGSMGGAGLSIHSKTLNVSRFLLINPISTLSRTEAPWESRYKYAHGLDWHTVEHREGDISDGYIVYDPFFSPDKKHALRYPQLSALTIPGLGHGIAHSLQDMSMLKILFNGFYHGNLDERDFLDKVKYKKKFLGLYHNNMWLYNKSRGSVSYKKFVGILKKYFPDFSRPEDSNNKSLSHDEINTLRDIAIEIEDKNISRAYELICIAYKQRPGYFLRTKLKNYRNTLMSTQIKE